MNQHSANLNHLTSTEIDQYASELEQAVESHTRWLARVNRALIFGEGIPADDLADHPHLLCHFGRWYHQLGDTPLRELPAFHAIGPAHAQAHGYARLLLLQRQQGQPLSREDYEAFQHHADELRLLIRSVRECVRNNQGIISKLMAKVFENATEGVLITAPDSTILTVNRAFTQVTGYSAQEVIGRTPHLLQSGRQSREFYREMWERLEEEGVWQGEIWNKRKNGDIYMEWLSIAAVRDQRDQVTHYVAIFSDITDEKESEERLYHLAHYDPLTELPNRVLFQDRFQQAIARARRGDRKIAVMFLDLDGFKAVNDRFGHGAGDTLLGQVGARLSEQLRKSDTVARLGGDEFAIILPDMYDEEGIAGVAEKVIHAIAQPFDLGRGQQAQITTSIGVSLYPRDGLDTDNLLQRADLAMYEAKRRGKNQYQFFDPTLE